MDLYFGFMFWIILVLGFGVRFEKYCCVVGIFLLWIILLLYLEYEFEYEYDILKVKFGLCLSSVCVDYIEFCLNLEF